MAETVDNNQQSTLGAHFRAGEEGRALDAARMLESLNTRLFDCGQTVTIGRFEVRERLGAGGMGVVMSAFDPQLQRVVAVKVLHDEGDAAEQARLLQEARAMAMVRHPNLVTVYEAGTHDDAVFIAMEFAERGTVRDWLAAEPRSWRDIVAVFVGAAEGLQAIHAAGMVHRDFKPDNVLLGDDGRALVSDFGLARPQAAPIPAGDLDISDNGDPQATQTRGIAGTPNYLAPEQWKGRRADAASDQWSFFVALHETLYGQRPFPGVTAAELCLSVLAGKRALLPEDAPTVPGWLTKIIDRGLSRDATERFSSMDEVVIALRRRLEGRRGKTVRAAVVASVVAASAAGVAVALADEAPCQGVDTRLRNRWTPAEKQALAERFAQAASIGPATWSAIEARLDAHVEAWSTQRRDACEATHVRGEQSEDALDLRMRCLDRRAMEVESLLATFEEVDTRAVYGAQGTTERLGELGVCEDLEFLRLSRPTPESEELRASVADFRTRASRLDMAMRAGKGTGNVEDAQSLIDEARVLDYEPLLAELHMLVGGAHTRLSQGVEAARMYEQAFEHALATQHLEVQIWSSVSLCYVYGSILRDVDSARRWGRQAQALLRAYGYFPEAARSVETNLGAAAVQAGEFDRGREHFETASRLYTEAGLEDALRAIGLEANLGSLARRQGRFDEAAARISAARRRATRVLAARHPMVGSLSNSLAVVYFEDGKLAEAEALYRESLELLDAELDSNAPRLGHPLHNLAEVMVRQGKAEQAMPHVERAVALWTADASAAKTLLHFALRTRAEARLDLGQAEGAAADLKRARELHPDPFSGKEEARYQWLLARASADPAQARRLVDQALELEAIDDDVRASLQAWPP